MVEWCAQRGRLKRANELAHDLFTWVQDNAPEETAGRLLATLTERFKPWTFRP